MLDNIIITAKHISGKSNLICDYLSQFKLQIMVGPGTFSWPIYSSIVI